MDHRAYKVELKLTPEQAIQVNQAMGVCRFIYNLFIETNQARYDAGLPYLSDYDFSKWLNNEWLPAHPEAAWIKDVSSKAVKKAIANAHTAYKRFFKGIADFPNFKRKFGRPVGIYLPKNNPKDFVIERHRVKIPTLGWLRLKEFGYLPSKDPPTSVMRRAGRYFASFLFRTRLPKTQMKEGLGLGIDLGLTEFATVVDSDGNVIKVHGNVNRLARIRRAEKRLKHEQRRFSRKLLAAKGKKKSQKARFENKRILRKKYAGKKQQKSKKERKAKPVTNLPSYEGLLPIGGNEVERISSRKLDKQGMKVAKAHYRLACMRRDYVNQVAASVVKEYYKKNYRSITIEDLNVSGMMKNRHLSKAIAACGFYYFRTQLANKCKVLGIELRIADRWYGSSKTCSQCGAYKTDLKLKDRIYKCPKCGMVMDRDQNAAVNLARYTA